MVGTKKFTGTKVEAVLDEFQDMSGERLGLHIGEDKRAYSLRGGLIECLAPLKPLDNKPKVFLKKVDWSSFPIIEELAHHFDKFFSKYDREVLLVTAKKKDGSGWMYLVPEQEGSSGGVEWEADEPIERLADVADWVGTIHSHPGNGVEPSGTDIDDWANPLKSGLHMIVGQQGGWAVYGAIEGMTFKLMEGSFKGVPRREALLTLADNKSLGELLKKPTFKGGVYIGGVPVSRSRGWKGWDWDEDIGRYIKRYEDVEEWWENQTDHEVSDVGDLESSLITMGALKCPKADLSELRLVYVGGRPWILTDSQYEHLSVWCTLPPTRRLHVRDTQGKSKRKRRR